MKTLLDSRALTLFLAVADSLSFRHAAEGLHMSQPPLSRAIRELEVRLGVRLFERDTRAVALTEGGRRLLPHARRVLRQLEEAERAVRAPDGPRTMRIGLTSAVEPPWFEGLAQRIEAGRPDWAVQMVSDSSPRLVRQLRARRLHAAFIALPTESAGLDVTLLDRQPMVVALPSVHGLARRRLVSLQDLADDTLYWFDRARQPAFFAHCQDVFALHGFAPDTLREPDDHHVLLAGVAAGHAIALLPRSLTAFKRRGVCYRALREGEELAVEIGVATPPGADDLHTLLVGCAGTMASMPGPARMALRS